MSRQAALRALELNGMLPEAHSMLGVLRALEFDWKEAEREFRVSLELDPRSEDVWVNYAWHYLTPMGRLNEAIEAMQKVLERDPLSLIAQGLLGFCNYFLRKWDDAILHWRSALDLDPQYYSAHVWLILNYIQKGMIDEGIQACETALSHWRDMNLAVGIIGLAFARAAGRPKHGNCSRNCRIVLGLPMCSPLLCIDTLWPRRNRQRTRLAGKSGR